MLRKVCEKLQGLDIITDSEMIRDAKRKGKLRELEEKKERNIYPKENSNHVSKKPRLC